MAEYISDKPSSEYQYGDQSKSGMYRARNGERGAFRATEKRARITEADGGVGGIFSTGTRKMLHWVQVLWDHYIES